MYEIETLSIDRVLNEGYYRKIMRKIYAPKASPRLLFSSGNQKQSFHARDSF